MGREKRLMGEERNEVSKEIWVKEGRQKVMKEVINEGRMQEEDEREE